MSAFFRQLGRGIKKTFGRQLPQAFTSFFGRQLPRTFKTLPAAFKDTSKVYSNLERKTHGIPVVPGLFKFASTGTQAIGDLLSGNLGKAYSGGKTAFSQGQDVLAQGASTAGKVAPLFL